MRYSLVKSFVKQFAKLSPKIQRLFWKQLRFLLADIRHPSLHAKKYDTTNDIWQARVDQNFRFCFLIERDVYVLLEIKKHPK